MSYNFPNSPTVGTVYSGYTWDGEKWTMSSGAATVPPLMDGAAAVGTSAQYARQDHVHPSDTARVAKAGDTMTGPLTLNADPTVALGAATKQYVDGSISSEAVRYDIAQGLTVPQQQQGRQNIYAAPFDALAYNGMQINGSMDVSQELGTGGRSNDGYVLDGWAIYHSGSMVVVAGQFIGDTRFPGFPSVVGISIATAEPSLGVNDFMVIIHYIEGYRVARLAWGTPNAQPITIGFWTAHFRVGTYSGTVRNSATNRNYAFSYTQNVSAAPEYKTITIPGDTAGTWLATNSIGMRVTFAIACGANNTAPSAGNWVAGNYLAAPGQVNGVAATTDVFRLTGVVVLPGNEAPSVARSPLIMRPYDQELVTCKRYWEQTRVYQSSYSNSGINAGAQSIFSVEKRVAPTATVSSSSMANSTINSVFPTTRHVHVAANITVTGVYAIDVTYFCDARL